jgi:hypothetical protein
MMTREEKLAKMRAPRKCKNFLCRQLFTPSPRFPKSKYCVSCTIDVMNKKAERKAGKQKTCKLKSCKSKFVGKERFCSDSCRKIWWEQSREKAIERKKERRASRRRKKNKGGAYPTSGFSAKRKQLKLFEACCAVTGISAEDHLKKYKGDLHLDHIVPARIANDANGDPHNELNMMWLSHPIHATKLRAEEFLRRARPYDFVLELQKNGWPMGRVKAAMKYYGMYSDTFPWGDDNVRKNQTGVYERIQRGIENAESEKKSNR